VFFIEYIHLLSADRDSESAFTHRSCSSVRSFLCLFVCLSVAKMRIQNAIFWKNWATWNYGLY